MMLSYEDCCKLKAAGYPQGDALEIVWPNDCTDCPICADYDRHNGQTALARPGSDELLADIQARWPDIGICITIYGGHTRVRYNTKSGWESRTEDARTFDAPTPTAALCALYLALAG